eukprot:Hpha_TRINITY_DN16457_c6_g4::TRINITY_DN16457_c6_g4_i1::g.162733::m.162733/K14834/NOC3; nucleolar complex protein 3
MERPRGDEHAYEKGKLKEIRSIHKREIGSAEDVARSLRDETQVWKDLLPGYKIKEMDEEDKSQMMSKEVRALQSVEQAMLENYRKFVGNLVGLAHKKNEDVQHLAVSCLCEILPQAQDFNYGQSVIDVIVDKANSRRPSIAAPCIQAVRTLLSAVMPSEAVLACLQSISDQVKERGELVSPRLIQSLLYVRLKLVNVDALRREAKERKQKKKQDSKLLKGEEALDASGGKLTQGRLQTNMLQKVVTTYLRVLDVCRAASRYRQSLLLGPTMEGLAKFSHLIDYTLFDLLLKAIRQALDTPGTTVAARLHGIITVASLAEQQQQATAGGAVPVDISSYYEDLYRVLPPALDCSSHHDEGSRVHEDKTGDDAEAENDAISTAASTRIGKAGQLVRNTLRERTERAALVIRACDLLLLHPKRVALPRVAAFSRRLGLYAVHTPPHIAVGILAFIRALGGKYPRLNEALGGAEEAGGGGEFKFDGTQPDHACALTCAGWEMPIIPRIYHPLCSDYSTAVLRDLRKSNPTASHHTAPLMGVNHSNAIRAFDISVGGFNPLPPQQNKHVRKRRKTEEVPAPQLDPAEFSAVLLPSSASAKGKPPPAKRARREGGYGMKEQPNPSAVMLSSGLKSSLALPSPAAVRRRRVAAERKQQPPPS